MINSVMASALNGLQFHQKSFLESADRISRWGTPQSQGATEDISLEKEMVGLLQSQRGMEANILVIKTEDEMLGSLLDILA